MQLTAFSGASNNDSPVATDGTRRKWCVSIERSHVTPGLEIPDPQGSISRS
jgi:hypothetical protein